MRYALILTAALLFILPGCQTSAYLVKALAPLENEGEVYLYTNPFPQEASRLKFSVAGMSAVRDDGREFPLSLYRPDVNGREMTRQRIFASGRLEPGSYTGFSIKAGKAALDTEEGEAALLIPKEPAVIKAPFVVGSRKAALLELTFNYADAVRKGFGFTPVFTAAAPEKPITELTGYVSNTGSQDLAVFDKKTRRVVGYIPTGRGPSGMAFDQAGRRAYVCLSGDDEVEVIDLAAGAELSRIRLDVGDNPRELGLTPDGRLLVTVNGGSNSVSFVDPASLTVLKKVGVGEGPVSILMDRAGMTAYVFNYRSNSISVLDLVGRKVSGTIPTEPGPLRGQLSRAGDRLYVVHAGSPYMTVFSVPLNEVLNRVYIGIGALSIKVDPRTDLIYVGKSDETRISVYDPFSFIPIDYIDTPAAAGYMAIDGQEDNLLAVMPDNRRIAVISLDSRKTIAVFDAGDDPYYISLMGERY